MILALSLKPAWDGAASLHEAGRIAERAEAAGLDLLLLDAGTGPGLTPDPLSVAAALIPRTWRIGLGAAIASSAWAPFNVARALSGLDLLSQGRAAWLALPGEDQPERFAEHADVVCALFDSWDDDDLVLDKAAGVFTDPARVRRIRHRGRHFMVDGPLNSPRPIQGRPVLIQRAPALGEADIVLAAEPGPAGVGLALLDLPIGPEQDALALAGRMAEAFGSGACDGFNLAPRRWPQDFDRILDPILPRLRLQGAVRPAPEGGDLRARLGLPRPANRFAVIPA